MVKAWVLLLFTYARGVRKSLFRCSTHEETEVMVVYSHNAEMVDLFHLCLWQCKVQCSRGNNLPITLFLVHGEQDGEISSPCNKLQPF